MDDLHLLPKIRDRWSYLYVEKARVDKYEESIAVWTAATGGTGDGYTPIPIATVAVLMLGPGTTITHAAIQVLAENSCLVVWCGEENVRFYAFGNGGTRSAAPLLLQAKLASWETTRLEVVRRMYALRFGIADKFAKEDTVESLRGREGARVREQYARLAREFGVVWSGRNYDRGDWNSADPVNRALSCANSCLYGLVHAALLATGYSPGIGFIHTGKQLSFVYDIADLYKVDVTLPIAFRAAQSAMNGTVYVGTEMERAVRLACRDVFRETRLLARIVPDIQKVLGSEAVEALSFAPDSDPALPTALWTPASEEQATLLPDMSTLPTIAAEVAAVLPALFGPDPGCELPPRRGDPFNRKPRPSAPAWEDGTPDSTSGGAE